MLTTDQMMTFAGTDEPCALMHIGSIGNLDDKNKIASGIFPFIKSHLGIDGTR